MVEDFKGFLCILAITMTHLHFQPIQGKTVDIMDAILHTGEVASVEHMLDKVYLIVEEVVANIVNYAYPDGIDDYLDVEIERQDEQITFRFRDGGVPFNPLMKDSPDISLPMAQRPIGGLGIYLIKMNADDLDYKYVNGENIFTVMKNIGRRSE